ncbi:glycosyltransferase [Confluentibacter flavum]|uniref:Glycosyltransferase family 1 protein n=1 Tax=Confluentibacter flavum TaxID=1909700 RepID=A0A2N3HLC3_9FLAO|nr:glycosyltransferase [Confluentibacter flavum]PKQ45747.1 glycosyltransferase family 1 protein [Confluentibacter flavum]
MKKIKVLHISETFAAGVYTYIKDICQYFDSVSEIESFVIYSGKRKDTDIDKFEIDFPKSIRLIEVNMNREISPIKDLISTILLAKEIRKIKPDVIHLHSSKSGVIGKIAAKACPTAKIYYTPNGYSFLREDISNFKKNMFLIIEKTITKVFGGITIACGDTEYEYAKKINKAILVRNGVKINDVYKLKHDEKNSNKKIFTVGTMGRISSQKNPFLFNEIALLMPFINFVWIGDGELKDTLSAKNITVTGWMKRENALRGVNDFDVYLQTSLWEGLPFTIIEAMVLEKTIIANNVIGNKDAVEHGYNGFLCNSVEDFIKGIKAVYNNESLKKQLEVNSGIRANMLFDRDKNFKILEQIYKGEY